MAKKILIIDDDSGFSELTRTWLYDAGYEVFAAEDGIEGLRDLYINRPDLVLLDVNLPEIDGWEVCRRIRDMCDIPVIMVSVNGQKTDLLRGFDHGATDYLTKPVDFQEIIARIRAALRWAHLAEQHGTGESFHDGEIEVNWKSRQVHIRGEQVRLSPTEFKLLSYLIKNRGRVVTHAQILEEIWGINYLTDKPFVKLYIRYLRKKIEKDPANPRSILTDHGTGYIFAAS